MFVENKDKHLKCTISFKFSAFPLLCGSNSLCYLLYFYVYLWGPFLMVVLIKEKPIARECHYSTICQYSTL